MRPWIEHLFNNAKAHADFLTYIAEIQANLTKKMQTALIEGKMDEARNMAHEFAVYNKMRQVFTIEVQDHIETVAHQEKGGR